MILNDSQLIDIGYFTFLIMRFERYLIDKGRSSSRDEMKPDFKKYLENEGREVKIPKALKLPELSKPINKRKLKESEEKWKVEFDEGIEFKLVLQKIYRLRNNLFHGNKALSEEEIKRNFGLIRESICVIQEIAKQDKEFAKYIFFR